MPRQPDESCISDHREDSDVLASCLGAGGLGYVLKISMLADLIPAMHNALAGRVFVSRFSSQRLQFERDCPGAEK